MPFAVPDGVLRLNADYTIVRANAATADLLDTDAANVIGCPISDLLRLEGGKPLAEYLSGIKDAAGFSARGQTSIAYAVNNDTAIRLSAWLETTNKQDGFVLHMHPQVMSDPQNQPSYKMLDIISNLQAEYIADRGPYYVFGRALEALLKISGSVYGFIGEILQNEDGNNYLKTHAITNIAWNDETRDFYKQNAPAGLEFSNLQSLFGRTVETAEVVIANDPMNDPRRCGLPSGHPPLNHYLGVPLTIGGDFVGMAGLANREGGYSEDMIEQLAPLLNTLSMLILAYRNEEKRKLVEAELFLKAQDLEEANQAKSRFLASMSHELRTPLNSIKGFATRLDKTLSATLQPRHQEALGAVLRNADHLLDMVNDILDLSKIEAGGLELNLQRITLASIIDDAMISSKGMADAYNVKLLTTNTDKKLAVEADPQRLMQVILNLISNAIKYGKGSNPEISIEKIQHRNANAVKLGVRDYGQGISESDQKTLFLPYTQLVLREENSIEGSGLGLSLVKELVELHKGEVGVESQLNQGSFFYIILQLSEA
jgi:signal transduction histidine kinase